LGNFVPESTSTPEISRQENFFHMKYQRRQKQPNLIQEQCQSSDPVSAPSSDTLEPSKNSLNINCEPDLDNLPIALRKGTRSCTKYPISLFVTTKNLSMQH